LKKCWGNLKQKWKEESDQKRKIHKTERTGGEAVTADDRRQGRPLQLHGFPQLPDENENSSQNEFVCRFVRLGTVWHNYSLWAQQGAGKQEFGEMAQMAQLDHPYMDIAVYNSYILSGKTTGK
ncbi:hypothetical protein HPB47_015341, partial [Ixodes persulcatus]